MKNLYFGLSFLTLALISSCASSRTYNQGNYDQNSYVDDYSSQPGPITYQQFYDDLSPYGNWVNYQNYGYVWMPNVSGFRPYYTNGHWVYTNYGWTWASDYNWGWAPFHYGRWVQDMAYGWMWVPGYEWAPAWVSWRGGGDYYGWAPLGPGMDINISMGAIPHNNWAFVPRRYINSPRINNYYVNQSRNVTIINNTTIINNNTTIINNGNNGGRVRPNYNPGPSVADVERGTNSKIRQLNVVQSNRPGSAQIDNNSMRVYRPSVNNQPANPSAVRPARVFNTQELEANKNGNIQRPNVLRPATTPNVNNSGMDRSNSIPPRTIERNQNNNQPQPQVNRPAEQPPANQPVNRGNQPGSPATPPVRNFNDQKPVISKEQNPAIMNNNTPAREPMRNLNNDQNPAMNRQNTAPVRQTQTPVNQAPQRSFNAQPQRQIENNRQMRNEPQVQSQPRNVRVETVRPAQRVERENPPERRPTDRQ